MEIKPMYSNQVLIKTTNGKVFEITEEFDGGNLRLREVNKNYW